MTSICLDTALEKVQKNVCCHILPCKINYNGSSSVSEYFTPHIREEDDHLKCSFRGRPLCGQKIQVPDKYVGVVLKDNKKLSLANKERDLKLTGTFDEFTAWNWDIVPSANDKLQKALQWVEVSSALHKPVSDYASCEKKDSKAQVKRKLSDSDR